MKKSCKKKLSVLLIAAIMGPVIQMPAAASMARVRRGGSSTQMVSDEEIIYLNTYGSGARTQNFDSNWKFYFGEADGAQEPAFDDSAWENIGLPHDYSITQEYTAAGEAESGYLPGGTGWYRKTFSVPGMEGKRVRLDFGGVYMNATVYMNGQKIGTHPYGYTSFSYDITNYINFNGDNVIAVKSDNKIPSSRWYSGSGIYRSVELTITDPVHVDLYGTKVELPNLESEAGGLVTVNVDTAVANDGDISAEVVLKHSVIPKNDPDTVNAIGAVEESPVTVEAGQTKKVSTTLMASNPELWSLSSPNLYLLRTEVVENGRTVDTYDVEFGFRYTKFDANTGFSLNGENMKLKGVCMHHDQGSLGAAAYYRAMERQVEILKDMGCNAIRVTHNPSDKRFMEICNEKGMLVIQEAFDTWLFSKNGNSNDYAKWYKVPIEEGNTIEGGEPGSMTWAEFDVKAMVKRDYNDPSLIMWSLGNEVMEGISGGVSGYPAEMETLIGWAQEADTTIPVTLGDNKLKADWSEAKAMGESLTAAGGTVGFNYAAGSNLDSYHSSYPNWLMYGAETASAINSRGIYYFRGNESKDKQRTAYDESCVGWGHVASDAWYTAVTRDYLAGEFVWTGFDYIGEPTVWNGTGPGAQGPWPSPKNSYFGIVDTAGFPKDSYYLYQSWWNEDVNTLHILPAWNRNVVYRENGNQVKVVVYSDAPSVELFFTPKGSDTATSLGRKTFTKKTTPAGYTYQFYEGAGASGTDHQNLYLYWMVPYEDGTITAKAYTDGTGNTEITGARGRSSVTTTGAAAQLIAGVDRDTIAADGRDLAYVTVDIADADGNIVPNAADRVKFTVEGDGELVGVDNGNSPDHDSYQADNRQAFSGKVLGIVRSTREAGSFTVTASAPGLNGSVVTVTTTPADQGSGQEGVRSYRISKNYYVKTGNQPELPGTVTTYGYDGTEKSQSVIWEPIGEELIQKAGSFTARGLLTDGTRVSVNITMVDEIAALRNYSAAVQVGSKPSLPATRPAVMGDGNTLKVQVPVAWDEIDPSAFASPGMVKVNGSADVFGNTIEVTADLRVSEESITIGSNVADKVLVLEQDAATAANPSDSLKAIIDGSTVLDPNVDEGPNESCWSNYEYSQAGGTRSEIMFTYATAERLGQAVVYFSRDSYSIRMPSDVELYYSTESTADARWIEIPATADIGTEAGNVTPYTYTFGTPVEAVMFKIAITNSTESPASGAKACTGITEVQLNRAVGSFVVHSDAKLSKLVVNGIQAPASSLDKGSYSTPALIVDTLEAEAKNNGALTVIPAREHVAKILIESEDHSRQSEFIIRLDSEQEADAEDDSRDYDRTKIHAAAQNSQTDYGLTPDKTLDDDPGTHWHTLWAQATTEENRWLLLELDDTVKLDAYRYLPKPGSSPGDSNGRIKKYRIEVSENGTDWTQAAQGTWPDNPNWKIAVFDDAVYAKYVKLWCVTSYGDVGQADKYVNAAEVRVREALPTIDLAAGGTITLDSEELEFQETGVPVEPAVYVTYDGQALIYGLDYKVTYENNREPGKATAIVKGILKYSGTVRKEFTILEKGSQEVSVSGGKITYIDNQPYAGEPAVKLAPGHLITVEADPAPEGKTFSHWRVIPSQTEITDTAKPITTFMVPGNACRLIAMFKNNDGTIGDAAVISKSEPSDWFAYADEEDLEVILAEALTEEDRAAVADGAKVELAMLIKKSGSPPPVAQKVSPPNAGYETASPSNAGYETASPTNAGYKTAGLPELGIKMDWEREKADRIAFYIRTSLQKTVQDNDGTNTEQVTGASGAKITFQLPEKYQNMLDYRIGVYAPDGSDPATSEIIPDVDRNMVSFAAGSNDAYILLYTLCHTVEFVDYDGRVIHAQKIIHGQGAKAPGDPYRDGYKFTGWDVDFGHIVKDLTVRACYEKDIQDVPRADKSRLENKIRDIEDKMNRLREPDYTADSWAGLERALHTAREVLYDNEAAQSTVDQTLAALEQAFKKLRKNPSGGGENDGYEEDRVRPAPHRQSSIPVTHGTWTTGEGQKRKFRLEDGSYAASQWAYIAYMGVKEWYYFGQDGTMSTGWMKGADGNIYYLDPAAGDGFGRLRTGWNWITGEDGISRCYYFQEESDGARGKLWMGTTTPDGYQLNEKGEWVVNHTVQIKM